MKAMMCAAFGPPESLKMTQVASTPVGKGQVRVAIHASGVNFPDTLFIQG
jgi:NADPH2:quinone reductase